MLQESEGGLYVCMNSFLGFGSQYVERHYARTGQRAYLHIKRTRKTKVPSQLLLLLLNQPPFCTR